MASTQAVRRRTHRRVDPRLLTGRASGRRSRRSRRQPAPTPQERRVVLVVVGLSALGGAVAGNHPTSNVVGDVVFSAAFAALLPAASSIARRWTWIVIAGVAAVCTRGALQALGFVVELAAIGAALRDVPHRRVVGAVIGAVGAQLLLRLGDGPFMASSALVVGVT